MPISPGSLPIGQVGAAYSAQFSTTGGQAPYTWALAPGSDAPPPGLALNSGGSLTGTPTVAGTFAFVIRLTDATGLSADHGYAVRINP